MGRLLVVMLIVHISIYVAAGIKNSPGYGYHGSEKSTVTLPASFLTRTMRGEVRSSSRHPAAVALNLRGGEDGGVGDGRQVEEFLNAVDLMGTSVFAFSGALTAGRKGMSLMGMWIIASLTATGGGTLRDVLLDTGTVFWMRESIYLKIISATVILSFVAWPTLERRLGWRDSAVPLCTADALGLAAFSVLGTQRAVRAEPPLPSPVWVLSGLMTSCFGGLLRDVLCFERPRIMYPARSLYAAPPLLGSALYTLLTLYSNVDTQMVASVSFLVTFAARVISWNNPSWSLPYWKYYHEQESANKSE